MQFLVQTHPANTQFLGRAHPVVAVFFQGLPDVMDLGLLAAAMQGNTRLGNLMAHRRGVDMQGWRQVGKSDFAPFAQSYGSLHDVAQFANVAGPVIRFHDFEDFGPKALHFQSIASRVFGQEAVSHGYNRAASIPEWRHVEADHIEPVEKIRPKTPVRNFVFKRHVACGNDASANGQRLHGAYGLQLPLADGAQQFGLQLQRQRVDFIEKQRAGSGCCQLAWAVAFGSCERPLYMAEQFAFDNAAG